MFSSLVATSYGLIMNPSPQRSPFVYLLPRPFPEMHLTFPPALQLLLCTGKAFYACFPFLDLIFLLRIHLHKLCLFSQPGFTSMFFQTSILHLLNKIWKYEHKWSSLLRNFISSKPVLSQISLFKFSSISYVNITSRSSFFGDVWASPPACVLMQ